MNHIKTYHRSILKRNHLEDLMRIRLNTVNEIEKFPANKYAKEFINNGHLRSHLHSRWTNKRAISLLEEENKKKKFLPKLSFL